VSETPQDTCPTGTAALSAQTEACRALAAENERLRRERAAMYAENVTLEAERDAALAVIARVTAWRDELASNRGGWDQDIAAKLTELLTAAAVPTEPPHKDHNPWDASCSRNGMGEPTREGAVCHRCHPRYDEPAAPATGTTSPQEPTP